MFGIIDDFIDKNKFKYKNIMFEGECALVYK